MDKVREKFEAWYSDGGYTDALVKKDGVYIYFDTQISWEAYQAAHESQQAEIDRLREALEDIANHGVSQSPAMNMPEEQWAWRCFNRLQTIAKEALK